MKKLVKKIILGFICIIGVVVLLAGGFVGYILLSYDRIGNIELDVDSNATISKINTDEAYSIATYNIGFGAYSQDYTFFLDTGYDSKGNPTVGQDISIVLGGKERNITIIDDICDATDCDVFIDCTNADTFIRNSLEKYKIMQKPVVIATTAFSADDQKEINTLATQLPIFMTGNFSIALHDFIETLKFAAKRISTDTDIQIVEYHHNQKVDAPSGTAIMIRDALLQANSALTANKIHICSVRGGNIFGEHEVIFANSNDEVITYKHQVSSRETFANGAVETAIWTTKQNAGLYNMNDFCKDCE